MTVLQERIFRRLYRDSVELMAIASAVEARDGVDRVGCVMATPANLAILAESDMLPAGIQTQPDDLIIIVRADDDERAAAALDDAEARLTASADSSSEESRRTLPRTIGEGRQALDSATLASVSVAGEFAAVVAEQALRDGLHVFCFSDNVPLEQERRLKHLAADRHLLMMGPDCGTAIIDGVPLGFANRVREGSVGIVAASGTGAQEVSCLLHRAGAGVSQLIGVGGRDLSVEVGGVMTRLALDMLAADTQTQVIVVVSKPPAPAVSAALLERLDAIAESGTPVVACLLGLEDAERDSGVAVRGTLEAGAIAAASFVGARLVPGEAPAPTDLRQGRVLGLYTGGTLASEAKIILQRAGVDAELIDLGDDEYTAGRPHPMIDPDPRTRRIEAVGSDGDVGVLLLDLVLGYGAHPDPASSVAAAVAVARTDAAEQGRDLVVVASVCGTDEDPQNLSAQRAALVDAGVVVAESNAAAARFAARAMGGSA